MNDIKKVENSFVILGSQHNPSVLIGSFFKDSGIIDSDSEINADNSIITPGLAQVHFNNGDTLLLNPERLLIRGKFGKSPFEKGIKYCQTLTHISYTAVGINLKYRLFDTKLSKFTPNIDLKEYETNGIKLRFKHEKGHCNLTLAEKSPDDNQFIELDFNFDYQVDQITKLGDLHIDVLSEREKSINKVEEVINDLF